MSRRFRSALFFCLFVSIPYFATSGQERYSHHMKQKPGVVLILSDTSKKHGSAHIGKTITITIRIKNNGNQKAVITNISCSNPCFWTDRTSLTIDSAKEVQLTIYFRPKKLGTETGILLMKTNDPVLPNISIALRGLGEDCNLYLQEDFTLKTTPFSKGDNWSVSHYLYPFMPALEWKFLLPGNIPGDKYILYLIKGSLGTQSTFHFDLVAKRQQIEIILDSADFSGGPATPWPFTPQGVFLEKSCDFSQTQRDDTLILRIAVISGNPGIITYSSSDGQCMLRITDPYGWPAIPIPLYPKMQAASIDGPSKIVWNKARSADTYNAQVARSKDFNPQYLAYSFSNCKDTSSTLDSLWNRSTYYWRVNAVNSNGTSLWSDSSIFTSKIYAPVISSPLDGSKPLDKDTTYLRWSFPNGYLGDNCSLQISEDSVFTNVIFDSTFFDNRFNLKRLQYNTKYYWRVRLNASAVSYANLQADTSEWTRAWSFQIAAEGSATPILLYPTENARIKDTSIIFQWTNTKGAYYYQIQIWETNTGNLFYHQQVNGCELRMDTLHALKKYIWRIDAHDRLGGVLSESKEGAFETLGRAPAPPERPSPYVGQTCLAISSKFQWTSVGVELFQAQFATDSLFHNVVIDTTFSYTLYPMSGIGLKYDQVYYWRVKAMSVLGNSPWSATWWFQTVDSVVVQQVSPVNGYRSKSLKVRLVWTKNPEAKEYEIHVRSGLPVDTILSNDTSCTFVGKVPLTYWWRVMRAGKCSPGSENRFTIVDSMTVAPALHSPGNDSSLLSGNIQFNWYSEIGARSYQVNLSYDAACINNLLLDKIILDTSLVVAALPADTTVYWRVRAFGVKDTSEWSEIWKVNTLHTTSIRGEQPQRDKEIVIKHIAPNPTTDGIEISFVIPNRKHIVIQAYDIGGRIVSEIENSDVESGFHKILWECTDRTGSRLIPGLYILQFSTQSTALSRSIIILR